MRLSGLLVLLCTTAFCEEQPVNCESFVKYGVTEYRHCQKVFPVTDRTEGVTFFADVTIEDCEFTNYRTTGDDANGGLFTMYMKNLVVTTSKFISCAGGVTACFYIDSSATATLTDCEFSECDSSREAILDPFTGWNFGGPDKAFGCISGKGKMVLTRVKFINNLDGCITLHNTKTTTLELTNCSFKDNRPHQFWALNDPQFNFHGADLVLGKGVTVTAEGCQFENKYALKGCALRAHSVTATFTDCHFTVTNEAATIMRISRATDEDDDPMSSVTLTRCSLSGPGVIFETWTDDTMTAVVKCEECVEFSGKKGSVTGENITLEGEDVISYDGVPCGGWPTTEEQDDPTTIEIDVDDPTTAEENPDPPNPEPGDPTKDTDGEIGASDDDKLPDDQKPGENPGLTGGEIAAIVVVPLAIIIGAVVLIVFFVMRKRKVIQSSGVDSDESPLGVSTEPQVTNYEDDALAHQ